MFRCCHVLCLLIDCLIRDKWMLVLYVVHWQKGLLCWKRLHISVQQHGVNLKAILLILQRNCCAHDNLRTTCVRCAIERGCVSLDCARHTRDCIGRWTDRVVHKSYKNRRTHSRIQPEKCICILSRKWCPVCDQFTIFLQAVVLYRR
jgi:hypothetical protein